MAMRAVNVDYRVWEFPGCIVRHYPRTQYTETIFEDGAKVPAVPQDTEAYRATAIRLGYGSDTGRMSRDHEWLHTFLAVKVGWGRSAVMWDLAHAQMGNWNVHHAEECLVMGFQAYLQGVGPCESAKWPDMAIEVRQELATPKEGSGV